MEPGNDDWLLPVHLLPAIYWLRLHAVKTMAYKGEFPLETP